MTLHARRNRIVAITIISAAGVLLVSACSNASAGSAPSTDTTAAVVAQALAATPTPTVVSNIPFPLDPAPTSVGQSSTTAPNQGSRRRDGEREGREGDEGGELGERGSIQRVAVSISEAGLHLSATTARAGEIEFDLTNQTGTIHHVLITGSGTNGDSGAINPGATVHLRGTLPAGTYQLSVDSSADNALSVTLQVQ